MKDFTLGHNYFAEKVSDLGYCDVHINWKTKLINIGCLLGIMRDVFRSEPSRPLPICRRQCGQYASSL